MAEIGALVHQCEDGDFLVSPVPMPMSKTITSEVPDVLSDDSFRWDFDRQQFVALPPKPSDWHVWSAGEWIDSYNPPEPAELAAALDARRTATRITRGELFRAARRALLIDMDEARQLSRGEIPLSLGHLIAALPAGLRDDFELQFIAAIDIGRLDVLILIIAGEMIPPEPAPGVTRDDLLDMLFGLRTWSEHYPEI